MQEKQEMNMKKLSSVKIMVIALLIISVIVFGSLSWFTMSKEVEGSGAQMTASDISFNIRIPENENTDYWNTYKELINMADPHYKEGEKESQIKNEKAIDYYKTTGKYESIIWRLDSLDIEEENNIYTAGLKPGSSGTLDFEIVPEVDGDLAVDIQLAVRGFTAVYPTQDEINEGADANEVKALNEVTSTADEVTEDEKNALKYINGHILYFTDKTNELYSGYIEDNIYHWKREKVKKGIGIPVEIHWIWVNTIDQIILKSTDKGSNPIIADSGEQNEKDRAALMKYIKEKNTSIFHAIDSYDDSEKGYDFGSKLDALTYDSFKNDADTQNHMTDSYNAADQMIGLNLQYILIDMKVSESTMNVE